MTREARAAAILMIAALLGGCGSTPIDAGARATDAAATPADRAATPADWAATPADGAATPADGAAMVADAALPPADAATMPADATTKLDAGAPDAVRVVDAPSSPVTTPGGCVLPACLAALVADCETIGPCVAQPTNLGSFNQCYDNGVKVTTGVAPPLTTARVTRRGGALCYTVEALGRVGRGGGMGGANAGTFIYRNPAGESVASGVILGGGADVLLSCATGGVPLTAPLRCTPVAAAVAGLVGGDSQASACPAGSCP